MPPTRIAPFPLSATYPGQLDPTRGNKPQIRKSQPVNFLDASDSFAAKSSIIHGPPRREEKKKKKAAEIAALQRGDVVKM
jgi:hypothetical protein